MSVHIDEKQNYIKRIEKLKEETERKNREIQKERQKKKNK